MTNLAVTKQETEMHLLGCCLLDPKVMSGVLEAVAYTDFNDSSIGKCFKAAADLWQSGQEVSPGTVAADLPPYAADMVWEAYESVGSAASSIWYAKKIKGASTRREIISRCKQIAEAAKTDDMELPDLISFAQTRIYEVEHVTSEASITDDFVEVQRRSEQAAASKYGTLGVPTGFRTLDNVTGGLREQDLIVVAARPSIGKTALATNIFQNIVEQTDLKAMFFSGEMSRHQLLLRMASRRSLIDNNALARGNLSPNEWTKYTAACGELTQLMEGRAWIDDKSRPSPGYIRALAKQKQHAFGLDIIFVDYLNIMSVAGKFNSTVDQLSAITGGMKALAKDMEVPVVLLAQINRGAEYRQEMYEPGLADLKGSGSIEEDADIVMFPHRSDRTAMRGKLIVAKHRNGPLANIPVSFDGATTSFKELQ